MAANPEGLLERAMTQHGDGRAYMRPDQTRAVAARLYAWKDAPETCKSCLSAQARSVIGGVALCSICREHRDARIEGMERLDRVVDVRGGGATGVGFVGHAIVFDKWSVDLGGFIERIRPEAVNRTLKEGTEIVALWNHESGEPLARLSERTMAVWKDHDGLAVDIIPPQSASNRIETVKRRDVKGMSFGFRMIEDDWSMDGHVPKRDVLDMRVSELSLVAFPAYPDTDVRVSEHLHVAQRGRLAWLGKWHRTRLAR
jgi:uncharacterized protein